MKKKSRQLLPRAVRLAHCILILMVLPLPLFGQDRIPSSTDGDNALLRSWRLALGAAIAGPPVAQTGSLAAICDDRSIRMVGEEGRHLWTWRSREALRPWLSRAPDGMLYAGSEKGNLFALNRAGALVWRIDLGEPLSLPVVLGFDGRLFVPLANRIVALTPAGRRLWSQELSGSPSSFCTHPLTGGVLAAVGNTLIHLGPFGERYEVSCPQTISAIAGIDHPAESQTDTADWHAVGALSNGKILLISQAGYREFASLPGGSRPLASEVYGKQVYVLASSGLLQAYRLDGGALLWQAETRVRTEGHLMADERGVYALGRTGASAYTHDKRRLWTLSLSDANAIAAFSDDGYVYSGGKDWVLYAYRAEDRVKDSTSPLFAPASIRRYGLDDIGELNEVDQFLLTQGRGVDLILDDAAEILENSGPGTAEAETARSLLALALSGTDRGATVRPAPAVLPQHRIRALELLSRFASVEQRDAIVRVFVADTDPHVRASAADCIALLGADPGGRALAAFERAAVLAADRNNDILMRAVARAAGSICRFSGPPLSERGIRLLSLLTTADRAPAIRRAAEKEIMLFRRPSP